MVLLLLPNIATEWARCSLAAIGFLLIFRLNRTFDLAYAGVIALAPYLFSLLLDTYSAGIFPSVVATILLCSASGIAIEIIIYRPLRSFTSGTFAVLLASLGVYVVIQNAISMTWGDAVRVLLPRSTVGLIWGMNTATGTTVLVACLLFPLAALTLRRTHVGLLWRAMADNATLATTTGLPIKALTILFAGAAYAIGAFTGLLTAWDLNAVPFMGLSPLMLGVVAVIIGRQQIAGIAVAAFVLSALRSMCAWLFGVAWSEALTFGLFCAVLLLKPQLDYFGTSNRGAVGH